MKPYFLGFLLLLYVAPCDQVGQSSMQCAIKHSAHDVTPAQAPTELVSVEVELEDAESHQLRTESLSFSTHQAANDVSNLLQCIIYFFLS